jgi:hypothetical protein
MMKLRANSTSNTSDKFAGSGVLQRKCACGNHTVAGGECEACRTKRLQRAAISSPPVGEAPPIVHEVLRSPGQPLDAGTRSFMEPRFGHDFSGVTLSAGGQAETQAKLFLNQPGDAHEREADQVAERVTSKGQAQSTISAPKYDFSQVRVHTDPRAAQSARAVHAFAYTVGRHIVFAGDQYAPGSIAGQRLLAHELTHVIQQKSGLASRRVQRASIPYRQVTWDDFMGPVPPNSTFGAETSSDIKTPGWKPKVDITDTQEACEVNKVKTTRHIAKVWVDPAVFDTTAASMDQGKSWARSKYKDPDKHCATLVTQCETEISKQASAASAGCKQEVIPCQEAFDKGSTSYSLPVDGTQIVVSSKAECSTKLVSECEQVMAKHHLFESKDHHTTVVKATTKADCSSPKFKEDCTKHYKEWSPRILKHEQGHFDIANVIAGKARADLKTEAAKYSSTATECGKVQANNAAVKKFNALDAGNQLSKRGQDWINLKDQAQKDYDDQTDHGSKLAEQATWDKNIAGGLPTYDLNKPAVPAAPGPQQTPPNAPANPGGPLTDSDAGPESLFNAVHIHEGRARKRWRQFQQPVLRPV